MKEYEICETCKGNHYETDEDGNYHLCSGCGGVEKEKGQSTLDTEHWLEVVHGK